MSLFASLSIAGVAPGPAHTAVSGAFPVSGAIVRRPVLAMTPSRPDAVAAPAAPRTFETSAFEARVRPLWLAAQRGDEAAYRAALGAIALRVRAFLRGRMQSRPDDVEDLLQEVLLALHLQRGSWAETVTVEAWVLTIARYKLVDLWRRHGRQDALHDAIDDVDEASLAAPAVELGAGRDLARLLATLPAAQREAIVLTKVEGLSVLEACARTGASESALKVQVHRGLKRLAALVRRPADASGPEGDGA